MKQDPIVQEVHRAREKLLKECGGELEKLMDRLKDCEQRDQMRIITLDQLKKPTSPNIPA